VLLLPVAEAFFLDRGLAVNLDPSQLPPQQINARVFGRIDRNFETIEEGVPHEANNLALPAFGEFLSLALFGAADPIIQRITNWQFKLF